MPLANFTPRTDSPKYDPDIIDGFSTSQTWLLFNILDTGRFVSNMVGAFEHIRWVVRALEWLNVHPLRF